MIPHNSMTINYRLKPCEVIKRGNFSNQHSCKRNLCIVHPYKNMKYLTHYTWFHLIFIMIKHTKDLNPNQRQDLISINKNIRLKNRKNIIIKQKILKGLRFHLWYNMRIFKMQMKTSPGQASKKVKFYQSFVITYK